MPPQTTTTPELTTETITTPSVPSPEEGVGIKLYQDIENFKTMQCNV